MADTGMCMRIGRCAQVRARFVERFSMGAPYLGGMAEEAERWQTLGCA